MLSSFHGLVPGVRLMVVIRNSREVLQRLLEFSIDVAVLAHVEDDPRVVAIPYSRHPVVAFVNRTHPWAGRKAVSIHDFSDEQVVLREEGSTTRLAFERSEEHTSELQSLMRISYAVFCLKKKTIRI